MNLYSLFWHTSCNKIGMRKKHILLSGGDSSDYISIKLLLDSFDYKTSVIKSTHSIWNSLIDYKKKRDPVDLIIFGTECPEEKVNEYFNNISDPMKCPPFIIMDDSDKSELISRLINCGFYGYMISPTDPYKLVKQVNQIFLNVNRYKE